MGDRERMINWRIRERESDKWKMREKAIDGRMTGSDKRENERE